MNEIEWAAGLVTLAHGKHHDLNTSVESCMECLRYWILLVWPQQERISDAGLTGRFRPALGKYKGGDPDDVREAREEIKRDKKGE